MVVRLAEAKRIVEGAIAKALELQVEVCVAVCNHEGRLIALNRMDGAFPMAVQDSIGKAIVSAGWGLPSGEPAGVAIHLSTATVIGEGPPPTPQPRWSADYTQWRH